MFKLCRLSWNSVSLSVVDDAGLHEASGRTVYWAASPALHEHWTSAFLHGKRTLIGSLFVTSRELKHIGLLVKRV